MERWRKIILFVGDIIMLCFAGYLMLILRFGFKNAPSEIIVHTMPFIIWASLVFVIFYIFNLYDTTSLKPTLNNFRQFIFALITSTVAGFLLFYFVSFAVSPKTNLLITQLIFTILILLWRRYFYSIFSTNFQKPIAFIGETPESKILIQSIKENPHMGYSYAGTFESLQALHRGGKQVETIVYTGENTDADELMRFNQLKYHNLDIRKAYQLILSKIPVSLLDDGFALEIIEDKKNPVEEIVKRIIDIIFSLTILILTFPITLLVSIAIYLGDRKTIFYKQIRVGYNGKQFFMIKFRSMSIDAEKNGAVWADQNDARATLVGKVIRKLHIDEIPQMLNILKGDITLVGPRPERPEFVALLEKEIPYYVLRQTIKPGFTGWAQIKFRYARSVMDSREKFEYDLYYIKNHTLLVDLGIILKTIQIIVTHH